MLADGQPGLVDASPPDGLHTCVTLLLTAHRYRDGFTVEHEDRVAKLSVGIGSQLGLSEFILETLRLSALLHDVGKIAVPAEILGKSGAYTDAEYAVMQGHCFVSYRILEKLNTARPIAEIAYQHHERLDGSGYPRGLSGSEIMLEARILAVADVYDAMTSVRPYRPGLPRDFVLGELQQMAGRLLDADVVNACRNFTLLDPPDSSADLATAPATARVTSRQWT